MPVSQRAVVAAACLLLVPAQAFPQSPRRSVAVAASAGMTNDDVIALASAGMSDSIIIAKIKAAPSTAFDTSVPGLKALKAANVSNTVVTVMIDPKAASAPTPGTNAAASAGNPDDPASIHSPGIYILAKGADSQSHMTLLGQTTPKQIKTNGAFASGMTYGLLKGHSKAVLDGAKAPVETADSKPTFYLYAPQGSSAGFGGSMYTPKEFSIIRFDVKGETRAVNTSSFSAWGASAGTDEKARQGFTSEMLQPGVYKLTPILDLPPGEYAFQQGMGLYFDFGVLPNQ